MQVRNNFPRIVKEKEKWLNWNGSFTVTPEDNEISDNTIKVKTTVVFSKGLIVTS